MAIVEFSDVSRVYRSGDHEQKALDHVNLTLPKGKFIVILGPSGAGKSTLLNLLGGLDSPTSGRILVDGQDISTLDCDALAAYRAQKVGFVFQFYNLIPTLTVHENVALVKEIAPMPCRPPGCSKRWASRIICVISRPNFPGVNSSGFPSRGHFPKIRKFCFAMNRRARWIPKPALPC